MLLPKHTRVEDRAHLTFVKTQRCYLCSGSFAILDDGIRRSDPHHIHSILGDRRRTWDWTTIPLCRRHHDWIGQTAEGITYELEHIEEFYGYVGFLLYHNGRIDAEEVGRVRACTTRDDYVSVFSEIYNKAQGHSAHR